jgi:hypothetical protein
MLTACRWRRCLCAAVRNTLGNLYVGPSTHGLTVTGGCDMGGSSCGSGILVTDEGCGGAPCDIIISGNHCYNNAADGITIKAGENILCQVRPVVVCTAQGCQQVLLDGYIQRCSSTVTSSGCILPKAL